MPTQNRHFRPWRRQLLVLALAVITMYAVLPQLGSFKHSFSVLSDAEWPLLFYAGVFIGLSYVFAGATYTTLALRRLRYWRTVLIQVAGMFVNRLLPAGIGGMGVNYAYLRRSRHSVPQAASVVAVNNSLGVVGHLLILLSLLAFSGDSLPAVHVPRLTNTQIGIAAVLLGMIAWLIFYYQHKDHLKRGLHLFIKQVLLYRKRPYRLLAALVFSIGLTLCNVLALWFCVAALHVSLPFVAILIIFSAGIALGTATPTPGGLGGIEAGLVAGLIVYQVDSATALAIVLVYRLISYWLPLFAGAAAFAISERLRYI